MLIIHRVIPKPRLIVMGQAARIIEPKAPVVTPRKDQGEIKMVEGKEAVELGGPDIIHQEKADMQGAVGGGGKNAPAQEKTPKGAGMAKDKKHGGES